MTDHRYESLPPDEGNARVLRLAHDLASGVLAGDWRNRFYVTGIPAWGDLDLYPRNNPDLAEYLKEVWNNQPPNVGVLEELGYIEEIPGTSVGDDTCAYRLTDKALEHR